MRNCLVLITSEYPYAKGEVFLESELPFHANNFDKIILLAVENSEGLEQTRLVPKNVDVYNVGFGNEKLNRVGDLIRGVTKIFSKSKFSESDRNRIGHSFKKRAFLEYFVQRAKRNCKECVKILDKYDFEDCENLVIYSYWFFCTAAIGMMIDEKMADKCKNIKLVSRAHGYDVYKDRNSFGYLPLREMLLERFDAVYPCSISGEKYISNEFPEFKNKIRHSYLGTFDCGEGFESNPNEFHIVTCSRITGLKRLDKVVEALSQLKDIKNIKLKWTHIGDGNFEKEIKQLSQKNLNFMQVNFAGRMLNREVLEFYKNNPVDLFLNVSATEGLPVSVMEAISFGTPVVATDVGGVSEIVHDKTNGILLDKDFDSNELVDAIKNFIFFDENERRFFRKNSRAIWKENFDATKNYMEFSSEIFKDYAKKG